MSNEWGRVCHSVSTCGTLQQCLGVWILEDRGMQDCLVMPWWWHTATVACGVEGGEALTLGKADYTWCHQLLSVILLFANVTDWCSYLLIDLIIPALFYNMWQTDHLVYQHTKQKWLMSCPITWGRLNDDDDFLLLPKHSFVRHSTKFFKICNLMLNNFEWIQN